MTSVQPSPALFADLYELTMAQVYWRHGMNALAVFSLFFRKYAPGRAYFVSAGLDDVLAYLENFRFSKGDLDYLRSLEQFDPDFLAFLGRLRFTGTVRAIREGCLFFADEPVVEVTAPLIEAQVVETMVVNQIHLQSLQASKAARVVTAARDRQVIDFGARRAHGSEAADSMARAGYLVGFAATSDLRAGARYGIPVVGTMAHSFITACPSEMEAYRRYAACFPAACTLLVDTYDTLVGVHKAITVAREMRGRGEALHAVRLDSGDLLELARGARALLDEAGFPEVQILASGGLDEYAIESLVDAGAPIDCFAVGTKVGVSADAPYGDCAYKLVAYEGRPVLKLSAKKQTLPGPKQIYRYRDRSGQCVRDVIGCATEPGEPGTATPLLKEVMRDGRRLHSAPSLWELREHFQKEFARLPERHKSLRDPCPYPATISPTLAALREQVVAAIKTRELGSPCIVLS